MRLPHARGGVSYFALSPPVRSTSSPRPWGCFGLLAGMRLHPGVFPTPVGVFLVTSYPPHACRCLPHARGGVSMLLGSVSVAGWSSPRPWGCFLSRPSLASFAAVFPTPVGVFLRPGGGAQGGKRLPHARGGVSRRPVALCPGYRSSPRPWGCFLFWHDLMRSNFVFPTPVGVFPPASAPSASATGLPHARGGVSALPTACGGGRWSSPRPWGCF